MSKKFYMFFDDMIQCDISISKTIYRYFRYTKSSLLHRQQITAN